MNRKGRKARKGIRKGFSVSLFATLASLAVKISGLIAEC
jgi:hypothetical protein